MQQFRGVPLIPPIDCTDPQSWIAERIYQMGADQELRAIEQEILDQAWFANPEHRLAQLRAARRPKPTSLKKQALKLIEAHYKGQYLMGDDIKLIRRALEQLDE